MNRVGKAGMIDHMMLFFCLLKWYNIVIRVPPIINCNKYGSI